MRATSQISSSAKPHAGYITNIVFSQTTRGLHHKYHLQPNHTRATSQISSSAKPHAGYITNIIFSQTTHGLHHKYHLQPIEFWPCGSIRVCSFSIAVILIYFFPLWTAMNIIIIIILLLLLLLLLSMHFYTHNGRPLMPSDIARIHVRFVHTFIHCIFRNAVFSAGGCITNDTDTIYTSL